jgi:phage shock protein A
MCKRKCDRRFEIRLPGSHPIWRESPGKRSKAAKEAIDLYFKSQSASSLLAGLSARLQEINSSIAAIEEAVARLEQKISALPDLPEQKPANESNQEERPAIDAAAFFDI